MQQQIYIEEQQALQQLDQIINPASSNISQEPIQEKITQQYQDDFEQIEDINHSVQNQQAQIQEEYPQDSSFQQDEQQQYARMSCVQLQNECKKLLQVIEQKHKQYISMAQTAQSGDIYKDLIKTINDNNVILSNFQQQKLAHIQSVIGRNTFSSQLLLQQDDQTQQQLHGEIDKIKALIILFQFQINRQQRQIKKYEQLLPEMEIKKDELYRKYKQTKRQFQEKFNKYEQNSTKEEELSKKLQKMRQKIQKLEHDKNENDAKNEIKMMKQMQNLFNKLLKSKETYIKRNGLISHQYQTNICMINKAIIDLNQQNQSLKIKISNLQSKNTNIESQSKRILQKYMKKKEKVQEMSSNKTLNKDSENNKQKSKENEASSQQRQKQEPQNYSQIKKDYQLITNINISSENNKNKNKRYFISQQRKNHIMINQSQIANTMTMLKQFKLNLPISSSSTQKPLQKPHANESKKLKISLQILEPPILPFQQPQTTSQYARQSKNKLIGYNQNKLTIAQRIQRIQLLERQDRIFSSKIYDKIDQLRQQTKLQFNKSVNKLQSKQSSLENNKTQALRKYKNNPQYQYSYNNYSIPDLNLTSNAQHQNTYSIRSQISQQFHSQAELPNSRKAYLINKRQSVSLKKEEKQPKLKLDLNKAEDNNKIQLVRPNDISFNESIHNESMTYMIDDQISLNTSRLSANSITNSKFMKKKRKIYGQKKISEDYMKILQERGRKILQLDNQNDP